MNEYREGKVKSTPTRGVKQFLKPDAYKQSERGSPKVSPEDRYQKSGIRNELGIDAAPLIPDA